MRPGLWNRLDIFARKATPCAVTFLLVLVNTMPLGLPGWSQVSPMLPLIAIYHWAVHRPELLPGALVFILGVVHDALNGLPLGLHAVIFLVVHGVVVFQRRFLVGKSFIIQWMGFLFVGFGATLLSWILNCLYALRLIGPEPAIYQYLVTLGAYPAVAWILIRWQQSVLPAE